MDYITFKKIKQRAADKASWSRFVFWAFNDSQFKEGCDKIGAKKNRNGKWPLVRIPGGGFIHVKGLATWHAFWRNWDKLEKKIKQDEKFIIDGLVYEYGNYEAHLDDSGDSRRKAEEHFQKATELQKKKAWKKFWNQCIKNDWF